MARTTKDPSVGDLVLAKFRSREVILRLTDIDFADREGFVYTAETLGRDTQGIPLRHDEVERIDTLPYIDPEGEDF